MEVNYHFVPLYKSDEAKYKSDLVSYAGKLLEISGFPTLIVSMDDDNKPFILASGAPLINALDIDINTY